MADGNEEGENIQTGQSWLYILLLSLAVLLFLQGTRELIGSIYNFNLSAMSINISIVAVFGFLSPALYPIVLKRLNQRHVMLIFGIIMVIARLLMSSGPDASLYLVLSFVLVSSALIFIISLSYLVEEDSGSRGLTSNITIAALIAVCLDMAFRAVGGSFDISIYGFTEARAASLLVAVPLIAIFFYAIIRFHVSLKDTQMQGTGQAASFPFFGINIGLLLFMYMTFSGYPNCSAGWTSTVPSLSYIIASISIFAFIMLFYMPAGRCFMSSEFGLLIFEAILAITFIILIIDTTGTVSAILLPASTLPLAVLFFNNINMFFMSNESKNRAPVNMFLTGFVFVVFVFLSVLTLTWAHVPGTAFLKDKMGIIALSTVLATILFTHIFYRMSMRSKPEPASSGSVKNRPLFVILCVLALICTSGFPAVNSDGIRTITHGGTDAITVMTYNIHQGYGMDGLLDPWEILNTIREVNPDILVLQESDTNRLSSMNVDILNWLACKLEMYVYSGPSTGEQIYGLALLSRYAIDDSSLYFLESQEDQRVWFRCQMQIGSETLAVYGIHMGLSQEDRTSQSNEVVERLATETMPFIMMGDFNTWPNETIYENLTTVMSDAWVLAGHGLMDESGYTFDSIEPYERIDYIFVSGELASGVNSCDVLVGQEGSDHLPLWVSLNIG